MRRIRVCAALAALTLVFASFFGIAAPALAEDDGMVRVRLTRLGVPSAVAMVADCDYYLASDPAVRIGAGERMTVSAEGEGLTLAVGRKRIALGERARLMRVSSGNVGVRFVQPELSNRFCGDLGFFASGGVINTILNIYIENYLYGVVGYEMPPSSGIEALKAQAVAARTYALRKKETRADADYDLTDTTADQVFRGYSAAREYANTVRAVDATRGGVLYSGSGLAQCYYSASNGGQTESTANAWGTTLSYSVVKDDPYDLESAATVRTATVNKDLTGLNESLRQALIEGLTARLEALGLSTDPEEVQVNGIESITACDSRYAAPSRVYRSLTFLISVTGTDADGARHTGTVSVSIPTFGGFEAWYGLSINPDDNETVWVAETEKAFTISFRRSGHGVGMSQRGAQVMAANYGMSVADILKFYYPGTRGKRLTLADTTRDTKVVAPKPEQEAIATARLSDRTELLDAPAEDGVATASAAAGAVVDVYAVQGSWAAVGSGGKYGYVPTERLESYTPAGSTVVRPEETTYATAKFDTDVLQLPAAKAGAVASMEAGSGMQVFAWTEAWAMVEAPNGFIGYVPIDAIQMEEAGEQAAPAPGSGEAGGGVITATDLYGQLRQDSPLYAVSSELSPTGVTLYRGSLVKILAYDQSWARVLTEDQREGYLPLDCIQALDNAASGAAEGGEVTRVSGRRYVYVKQDTADVYERWSTDSRRVATLPAGTRVRLGAYNRQWVCVRLDDGTTGYMLRTAVTDEAPAAAVEGGEIALAPAGTTALAARDGVAVYRSYSESADVIARLDRDERVEVGAYNTAWAFVRIDGLSGYVRIGELKLERAGAGGAGASFEPCDAKTTAKLNLYAAAKAGSRVLARIPKGAKVRVNAWRGGFAYVEYNGQKGYVKLKYLNRIS